MGMFAFRLTLLFCSLTIYKSLYAASVLENSSDLWRNWLLNETEEIPSQQGPPPSRRITPKSVFIAPIFDKCPPGTRLDAIGNCVKIVHIDKWENLVNKLNAAFALTSSKPISVLNETTTTARAPLSTITTTTTTPSTTRMIITTNTITTTTSTSTSTSTEADVPSSTLPAKEDEQPNNTTYVPEVDISGPLQLSIPLNSKNSSSEETDAEKSSSSSSFVRSNTTNLFNESGTMTTTEVDNPIEFSSYKYDMADTTMSPQVVDFTFSTVYPDTNTAESVGSILPDVEYDTEMTTESTTLSDFSTETPSLPKTYNVRPRPAIQQQQTSKPERTYPNSHRPGLLNEPKLTVTPVANLIYSYTSGDILKIPVRFPEFSHGNKSGPDRVALNRNGAFSATNTSDINDTTSAISDSVSNSNKLILSSNSAKNDLYQKLPTNGKTRPKCDPTTGYGDCVPPSKLDSLIGSDKTSYLVNLNRGGGGAPPVTTIIRFPGMHTKGTSVVRFPSGGNGGGIADQQFKPSSKVDETIAFPEMEIGASASRYWDSNRYPASYWNPWDASKPHFVRIWPSNNVNVATPVTTTYNLGSDINYNYRSQADYS